MSSTINYSLGWLHISDLHFLDRHAWRDNLPLKKLLEDLEGLLKNGLRVDLVLCTGDIGFGGTKAEPLTEQYANAKAFFDKVLEICALDNDRLFLVPGNHDIDRDKVRRSQTEWFRSNDRKLDQINQDFRDNDAEIKQAMERLNPYRLFIVEHYPHICLDNNATFGAKVEIDGISISIAGLNSAWTCADNEDKNKIWLAGEAQLHASAKAIEAASGIQPHLRLALLHHPQDWLQSSEAQQLRGRMEQEFDFLLHGHAHDQWVREINTPKHVVIAAGATTGESQQEFGYNLVQLANGKAVVHLRRYDAKGCGWIEENIHERTEHGVWTLAPLQNLPAPAPSVALPYIQAPSVLTDTPVSRHRYGLDTALRDCSKRLKDRRLLAVVGMAGVGKSVLVEELCRCPEWRSHRLVQITAQQTSGITDFFSQIAHFLGIHDECPCPPVGETAAQIAEALHRMAPDVAPFFLHVQRAHLWFRHGHLQDAALARLLEGLSLAYPVCPIVLETREQPETNLVSYEFIGLPKQVLADYLANPPGLTKGWTLNVDQRAYLFTRLGGGHGRGAHAYGLALLVRLAAEKSTSPYDVLKQYPDDYAFELYDKLFRDIYENILTDEEKKLLFACALYRDGLHYSHLSRLEQLLPAQDAGAALIRRRLLTENADWLYLHDLAAEQACKLGSDKNRTHELHQVIASFFLDELRGQKSLMNANIRRALEALYHLEQGGQGERVVEIASTLFGRRPEETVQTLWRIEKRAMDQGLDDKVCIILEYLLKVSPDEHRAMRFLGECRRRIYGSTDSEALELFRRAIRICPDFPAYWSNFGHAAIDCGNEKILAEFLTEMAVAPGVVQNDDYVAGIWANAMGVAGRDGEAAKLREERIAAGSLSPAFYVDQAKWLLDKQNDDDANTALKLLELARQRNCSNDFTEAIYATTLVAVGRDEDAAKLRQEKIDAGSPNPAFYVDHAKWLMRKQGNSNAALDVLNLARRRGYEDDVTNMTRRQIEDQQHK